tara:strand:+ start:418 stop:1947 length:1530 start_codon:yes stop_codon:yes gene_type:complete
MPKKSLAETNPEVAKQWHPTLNGDLTPNDFTPGSSKKVWWKCPKGDDHEWATRISHRSKGSGCPFCAGQRVTKLNSLSILRPEIAEQWHPTKNGNLTPKDVMLGSHKKVWWKCPKGDDHEWQSFVYTRGNHGCPICSGRKTVTSNCLATLRPDIAKEWHPTKNGNLTPNLISRTNGRKVWWKCDKGDDHEWEDTVANRDYGRNCPVCSGHKAVKSNCLATLRPDIAKEWHPTKNGNKTPLQFTVGSEIKIWWKCDKGEDHEWMSSIVNRTKGRNCPICSGRKTVTSNCLATLRPDIAKEWHPTKNGNKTPLQVAVGYNKRVWWKCNKGDNHEWFVSPNQRTNYKTGCPFCTLTPQSKQELTITFELMKLFKNIDPKGLKTKLEGKLRAVDIFIPKLNLCIEFDGSYWHKYKRDIDKIKSEMLFEEGFKLIRVCEEPLEKLYDTDIISKIPYNGKQVTNDVLSMIISIFDLDAKLVSKIKEYQSKDGLQNEKGLNRYIDKILTEKAERNN